MYQMGEEEEETHATLCFQRKKDEEKRNEKVMAPCISIMTVKITNSCTKII